MRAKGLLSIIMTGAMMASVLSGCGFKPDITWTDTADGSEASYKVTVVVAHDGKLNIKSEQTVKDGDTLNFVATPSKDGDHRITGLMIDGVKRTDYTGELPLEGEVKISLENINQDMTVVVLCDNETGGLGGVDGAVTGLDGTGDGDLGGGTGGGPVNPGDDTPAATEYTVTFTADGGITHKAEATGTDDENPINFVDNGRGVGVATVEEGSNVDVKLVPEEGWRITDITISGESEENKWTEDQGTGAITFDLNNVDENITIQYTYVQVVGVKFDENPSVEYDFDTGEYKVTGGKVGISYSDGRDTQTDHLNNPQHGQVSVIGSPEDLEYGEPATVTVVYTPNPVEGVVFTEGKLNYDCKVTVEFDTDSSNKLEQYFNKRKNGQIKDFGEDMSVQVDEWAKENPLGTTGTVFCEVPDQPNKSWTHQLQRVTVSINGPESAKKAIDDFYAKEVANARDKSTYHGWVYVRVDINEGQTNTMTMWVVWYEYPQQ